VSESDRDLVIALRAELAAIDPARACDRRAEGIREELSRTETDVAQLEEAAARVAISLAVTPGL